MFGNILSGLTIVGWVFYSLVSVVVSGSYEVALCYLIGNSSGILAGVFIGGF